MTQFTICQCRELFGQHHHRFMGKTSEHGMFQGVELMFQCIVDAWVGVTKQIDPPRADGVKVAVAIVVIQPSTAAALNSHQWHSLVVLHLGTRVPDTAQTALNQL